MSLFSSGLAFTFFARGNTELFVAAAQIFALLLMYSVCDADRIKSLQKGDLRVWELIDAL